LAGSYRLEEQSEVLARQLLTLSIWDPRLGSALQDVSECVSATFDAAIAKPVM
jgi:hypothetical protein